MVCHKKKWGFDNKSYAEKLHSRSPPFCFLFFLFRVFVGSCRGPDGGKIWQNRIKQMSYELFLWNGTRLLLVPVVLKPSTSKSGPCSQKLVLRGAAERSYVRKSYKPIHVTYLTFYFGGSLVSQKLTGLYWMLEVVNCQLGQFLNFLVCNDAMVGLGDSRPGTRLSGSHDAWCSLQIQMGPQKEIHSTNKLIVLICINIILILPASRACAFGNVPILEALAEVLRLWPGARCYEGEKKCNEAGIAMHRVAKKSELRTNIKNHQNASTCYIYMIIYCTYYICGYICFVSLLGYFKNDIWWTLWQSWLSLVVVASSSISVLQYVLVNPFCRWWIAFRSHF